MEFNHRTVLLSETIQLLNINPNGVYLDATAGGGGLSESILNRLSENGRLICLDRDPDAILQCSTRLKKFKNVHIIESNFSEMQDILSDLHIKKVDGIVLDLGVSSYQLDEASRGFSYKNDGPLDMRMSKSGISAYDVVNGFDFFRLSNLIRDYGEELYSKQIAKAIINRRNEKPINSTLELVDVISKSVPNRYKRVKHPAKKTFQALRVYVNNEYQSLRSALDSGFRVLNVGGRLCVITFHSIEDRIVKHSISEHCKGCICPNDFPICVCGRKSKFKIITKKPIVPSQNELLFNPRSRSAKLRVCEKIL